MSDLLDQAISEAVASLDAEPDAPAPAAPQGGDDDEGQAEVEVEGTDELDATEDDPADDENDSAGEAEDAEGDAEDSSDDDHEDDDGDTVAAGPVEVAADATYRLADGTEVTGSELKDGWLRHADYTRKTQELATQRQESETLQQRMADWYEERAGNPAAWINEIAQESDNPAATIADALAADKDPTNAIAWVLRSLAERGKLDTEFVKQFGLEGFADKAGAYEADTKLSRLERQVMEEREAREKADRERQDGAKVAAILADYERQWTSIVQTEGLEFPTPQVEQESRLAVMRFARDNEIPNLEHAYAAYQRAVPVQAKAPNVVAKETVERKRQARAVSPKAPPAGRAPRKAGDIEGAMREAAGELGMTHLS